MLGRSKVSDKDSGVWSLRSWRAERLRAANEAIAPRLMPRIG